MKGRDIYEDKKVITRKCNKTKSIQFPYLLHKKNGFPPSIREIAKAVGLKSTLGVYSHLKKLQEEGLIEIRGNSSRAIKILGFEFREKTEENDSNNNVEE